jgi:iron(III) transport system ATP-binding protein/putative spermidine/putrescine transport system ATP-binding protein
MSSLSFDRLVKRYGDSEVVKEVSLTIEEGEFVSLLGPSGCGKTTILRMVAGLVPPSQGRILIGADDVTMKPPNKRGVGLVFQSYALFPHLTVFDNVAFGLRRQGTAGADLERRIREMLALVRLDAFGGRYPRQLSGGQQQRVAIARAVAPRPRVLLFDEPLSNLDARLRDEMQIELKRLQRGLGITTVFVTHDQSEALSMSDRVCVLAEGVVQQFATPEELYHRPRTAFVAGFLGRPNKLSGVIAERTAAGGAVRIGSKILLPSALLDQPVGEPVEIIIRQEAIGIAASPSGLPDALRATILMRSFNGARVQYLMRVGEEVELIAETSSSGSAAALSAGGEVELAIDPSAVFAMPVAKAARS